MITVNRSVSIAPPGTEPVSITEALSHLEIAASITAHNTEVTALITAARERWVMDTQYVPSSQVVTEQLDTWPDDDWRFYYRPIQSVSSIQYYDTANALQTWNSDQYSVDLNNRALHLAAGVTTWPSLYDRWDAITITYTAGDSTALEIIKSAIKLQLDLLFELKGMTKDKDKVTEAYEAIVALKGRPSYP